MFISLENAKKRYSLCISCDKFNSLLKTCKECGCFMPAKTTIANTGCPLQKWGPLPKELDNKDYKLD